MKQEVFLPTGERIFSTDDKRIMYDEKTIASMKRSGYKVKLIKDQESKR